MASHFIGRIVISMLVWFVHQTCQRPFKSGLRVCGLFDHWIVIFPHMRIFFLGGGGVVEDSCF